MRIIRFSAFVILWALATAVWAADISVPRLELSTYGGWNGDKFVLSSHATADIAVSGGYKYGALVRFGFDADDLEKALMYAESDPAESDSTDPNTTDDEYNSLIDRLNNSTALSFKLAKMTVREPFKLPIELSYFIGRGDDFCSGGIFSERFGIAPIASAFRGWAYYPSGIAGDSTQQYEGIYRASGTGLSLAYTGSDVFIPMIYGYQDSAMASAAAATDASSDAYGYFSGDIRFLVNTKNVKLEGFGGVTGPYADYGVYRAGLLAYLSTGVGASFLAQAGIPRWDATEAFSIDNLYVLFEPRMNFGFSSVIITVFYHPAWYCQKATGEQGNMDLNLRLLFGDIVKNAAEGGLETTLYLDSSSSSDPFELRVSPFFGVFTEGLRWDFKVKIDPLAWDTPLEMVQTYIGVRTAF